MKALTTGAKLFLALLAVLSVISFADFAFGGKLTDLLIGIGFALMASGITRNGLRSFRDTATPASDKNAAIGSGIGTTMVLGSIAAGYLL